MIGRCGHCGKSNVRLVWVYYQPAGAAKPCLTQVGSIYAEQIKAAKLEAKKGQR